MEMLNEFDFGQVCFESDTMQILFVSRNKRDATFPLTRGPINFSVLRGDGKFSNRWGVTTSKHGDAYVYCRDVPNAEKVSLHTSGRQHISMPSINPATLGEHRRYGNVWTEPEFEREAIATFSLIFPPWGVGLRFEPKQRTKDEILIAGHREKLVVVSFFVVDSDKKMQGRLPHFVLGQLPLRAGKTLHVITWKEPQNDLLNQIQKVFPQVSPIFSELKLGEDDYTLNLQGYRGPNSAYIVTVPVHYTPHSETA